MTIPDDVSREIKAAIARIPGKLQGVHFTPWVGMNYQSVGFKKRKILVLGESHYRDKAMVPDETEWTCQCVAEQVATDYRFRFWTGIAKSFLGKIPNLAERKDFWHSIAFYNYVQKPVGKGPRVRPTEAMWKGSEVGFQSVLEALAPDLVVAFGKQMWEWLPHEAVHNESKKILDHKVEVCGYRSGKDKIATTVSLPHPSSAGFNGATWHPVIKELITGPT